jgi:putative addiction module component (TIGR02574 family)
VPLLFFLWSAALYRRFCFYFCTRASTIVVGAELQAPVGKGSNGMTHGTAELLEQALRLSEQERADLAARLLDSLEPAAEENVVDAWSQEIQNRLEELDASKVQPIPWAEARRMIQDPSDDTSAT